jgi:hypothetical protein
MSTLTRDETRVEPAGVIRHVTAGCVLCGAELCRAGTGRRRLYCGQACRQRAYRLRDEARRQRAAVGSAADPAEVTALLNAVIGLVRRR